MKRRKKRRKMLKHQRKDLLLHQLQNHRLLLHPLSSLGLPCGCKQLFNTCFHFIEKNENGSGRRWRRRRRVSVVSQYYFVLSTFYSPLCFFKKNGFVCSDDEDDDDDEDEEDDDEEEDIEESPVKARSCFGSSTEYIWWGVSLIYLFIFLFWYRRKQHRPNRNHQLRMERVLNQTPPHRSRWYICFFISRKVHTAYFHWLQI